MLIEFSRHAERRMKKRGISKMQIERMLTTPLKIEHLEGDKFMYYHKQNGAVLVAVVEKKRDRFTVITTYHED
mgnify:CR=1 FL=1